MKRNTLFTAISICVMVLTFTACGKVDNTSSTVANITTSAETTTTTVAESVADEDITITTTTADTTTTITTTTTTTTTKPKTTTTKERKTAKITEGTDTQGGGIAHNTTTTTKKAVTQLVTTTTTAQPITTTAAPVVTTKATTQVTTKKATTTTAKATTKATTTTAKTSKVSDLDKAYQAFILGNCTKAQRNLICDDIKAYVKKQRPDLILNEKGLWAWEDENGNPVDNDFSGIMGLGGNVTLVDNQLLMYSYFTPNGYCPCGTSKISELVEILKKECYEMLEDTERHSVMCDMPFTEFDVEIFEGSNNAIKSTLNKDLHCYCATLLFC